MTLPADLTLRVPGAEDVGGIAALVARLRRDLPRLDAAGLGAAPARPRARPLARAHHRRELVDARRREPGGRIVGLVCFTQAVVQRPRRRSTLEPIPGRAHVSAVFTHPDRWREGVAAGLLEHAEAAMRAEGYTEVQLWTPRDAPARHFYEATGWAPTAAMQWLAELALPIVAYVKAL